MERKKSISTKKILSFVLTISIMAQMIVLGGGGLAGLNSFAAAGDIYPLNDLNGGQAEVATSPDGQPASRLVPGTAINGGPWDNLFTPSIPVGGNLSDFAGGYFVFEIYVPNTGFRTTTGNNWLVLVNGGGLNDFNTNSRLNLTRTNLTNAAAGTWATVYAAITSANTAGGTFNTAWMSNISRIAMHMQWGGSVPNQDVFIRNARFQKSSLGVPASPQPTALAFNIGTRTATATTPANGQAVEFAYSVDGNVPTTGWVNGTLSGTTYTAQFAATPSEDTYYVFARAIPNADYTFTGTSTRITVTTITDADLVAAAANTINWNLIRNANPAGTSGQNNVTTNLNLPTTSGTTNISWSSNNTATISNAGIVNRLNNQTVNKTVRLTATVSKGSASQTVNIDVIVQAVPIATVALPTPLFPNASMYMDTAAPDGNMAMKLNDGMVTGINERLWDARFTVAGGDGDYTQNYLNYANQYFVFDLYLGSQALIDSFNQSGNNWIAINTQGNSMDGNSRVRLNAVDIKNASPHTWITVYAQLSSTNSPNGFNPTSLASVSSGRLQMQWTTNPIPTGDIFMKNPRFQSTNTSPKPVPTFVEADPNVTVSAVAPANGQAVEFAITNTTDVPTVWTAGTLDSGSYTITYPMPTGSYYVYARTMANATYNFDGTHSRAYAEHLDDTEIVANAKAALIWDTIKNANTAQNNVLTNLTLPATGIQGSTITWASGTDTIISNAGVVTRPEEDTDVTITATITSGAISDTKDFVIKVIGTGSGTDDEAVANAATALTWDIIKGVNTLESNVTTNLVLPATGVQKTTITWVSNTTGVMSNAGIMSPSRPTTGSTITMTATIRRGAAVTTKVFTLIVPDRYDWEKHVRMALGEDKYEGKSWAISDFNVLAYGAKTEEMALAEGLTDFCNRAAFQAAIDAAYANGGGVVYAPAGVYAFRTEVEWSQVSKSVTYYFNIVLDLKSSVQIRGDWVDPDKNGGKVEGTILAVYPGRNTANFNKYVPSNSYENQTGSGRLDNVDDRFINMVRGTGVTNLSVWYPEQKIDDIVPYPWTFYQRSGDSATIDSVTLVNSYGGFISLPSELHYVVNTRGTALNVGVRVHTCTDIGRVEDLYLSPKYWANSGLPNSPTLTAAREYTRANSVGFEMHRSDWEYVSGLHVSGYKTGMWVGREPGFSETPNAQFYGFKLEDCVTGMEVEAVNGYGLLISNSEFGGDRAVYFSNDFSTSVQFNGVDFKGPIVSDASGGVVSFESCTFDEYGTGYALNLNKGNVLLSQSNFKQADKHVNLGSTFGTFKSLNSGYNLDITKASLSDLFIDVNGGKEDTTTIINDAQYIFEGIPKDLKTNIDVHPKPSSKYVLRVDLPRVTGDNSTTPSTDIGTQLQNALDYIKATHGGGTVYLPGGRYRLNTPIVIPEGVELRGSWDVQHHTEGGGVGIFTAYTGSGGGAGASLIQLKKDAGIRGFNLTQTTITSATTSNLNGYVYPFLIQGQDTGVYAINITIPIGDKGIDLASYDTSGHYVDYLGGSLLRAGIWVGGGATGGFIRNMQFNPHYTARRPQGNQGYPNLSVGSYIQSNASALKFGDVENETIFNNFVYGSINGIHFLKDTVTGNYPGQITVIGHGSDGCTFSFSVQDADANTKIIGINSELVNTNITSQTVRSYVRMGYTANDPNVHPDAQLTLFNTAFWGSPTTGAFVNNGIVRYQQVNFTSMGSPAISVNGGQAHIYNTYFRSVSGSGNAQHAILQSTGESIELSNNFYSGAMKYVDNTGNYGYYGSDIDSSPFAFSLVKNGTGIDEYRTFTIQNVIRSNSGNGTVTLVSPDAYAADFKPVPFESLAAGEKVEIDLPRYIAGLITFEIIMDDGRKFIATEVYDVAYAEKGGATSVDVLPSFAFDTADYVRANTGPLKWDSPDDLSSNSYFSWDDSNLYIHVVVTDPEHTNEQTGANIWNGDSLQFGIDLTRASGANNRLNEIGFAVNSAGDVTKNRWTTPSGVSASTLTNIIAEVVRDDSTNTTTYDIKMPFASVYATPPSPMNMAKIGISVFINDAINGARAQEAEVVSGHLKNSALYTDLYLLDIDAYEEVLEDTADDAVDKALASEEAADIIMAYNFIALVGDETVKQELIEKLTGTLQPEPVELFESTPKTVSGTAAAGLITFTWEDPNPEALATEYYNLYMTDGTDTWLVNPIVIDASEATVNNGVTSITFTFAQLGITNSGAYDFKIEACNWLGESDATYLGGPLETDTATRYKINVAITVVTPNPTPAYYVLTFQSNGGSAVNPVSVTADSLIGDAAGFNDIPVKTDYIFCGWYLDEALTMSAGYVRMGDANRTVYASWVLNTPGTVPSNNNSPLFNYPLPLPSIPSNPQPSNPQPEVNPVEPSTPDKPTETNPGNAGNTSIYNIISGGNSIWIKEDTTEERVVTSDGPFAKFIGVKVDNELIEALNYTAVSGSTIITLKQEYIETLEVGEHDLEIMFTDGSAKTKFTILSSMLPSSPQNINNPKTTDVDMSLQIILISIIGMILVTAIVIKSRKAQTK